jgi:hypothetical protein
MNELANTPLAHEQDVLLCGEHHLVQWFPAGTLWAEVYAVIEEHKRESHGGDQKD